MLPTAIAFSLIAPAAVWFAGQRDAGTRDSNHEKLPSDSAVAARLALENASDVPRSPR